MEYLDAFWENPSFIFYGATIVLALVKYPKYYDTPLKFFPVLLMYVFLNEMLGRIIDKNDQYSFVFNEYYSDYNMIIYNIFNIIFYLYFFYVFSSYVKNQKHKKMIIIGSLLFILVAALNPFFQSFMLEAQVYTYVIGAIVLLTSISFYFIQVREATKQWFLNRDIMSWIGLGMLVFYLGYLPIKINRYYNGLNGLGEAAYVRNIQIALVLIMYSCFIVGFLRIRRTRILEANS